MTRDDGEVNSNGNGRTPDPFAESRAGCPSAEQLSGYAEGGLLAAERAVVERHVGSCEACRLLVEGLADDIVAGAARVRRAHGMGLPRGVVLVLVVAALIGAYFLFRHPDADDARTEHENDERMVISAAIGDLARKAPDLFGGFTLLTIEELSKDVREVERGGAAAILSPRENVLSSRPPIVLEGYEGVANCRLVLEDSAGTLLFDIDVPEGRMSEMPPAIEGEPSRRVIEYPDGVPETRAGARYVLSASAPGAIGSIESSVSFMRLDDVAAARWARAAALVRAEGLGAVGETILVHYALRMGLLTEAEAAARAVGGDEGAELVRAVLRREGSSIR